MTRAERVYRAINHQEADRVPKGEWQLDPVLVARILGKEGSGTWEDEVAVRELLGMDLVGLAPQGLRADRALPAHRLGYSTFERWRRQTDFFIFALVDGPFQGTAGRMDFVEFLLRLSSREEQVKQLAWEEARFGLETAWHCLRAGAHAVIIADDIAYTRGTYVAPGLLREIFLPLWRWQVENLKAEGSPVFFHSDGNITSLLPDLVDAGFTGLHSLEPSAGMDMARIKQEYGARLCLMGNFDLDLLARAEEEEIAAEVQRIMLAAAPGGGFIFSTSSGCLGGDLPVEKVVAMYRAAGRYGSYL
ncbi:uroporphyrinogen decarboxylase family protein [Moorellaceae bacterium AZ2]